VLFESALADPFIWVIGIGLIVYGLVLAYADRRTGTREIEGGEEPFGMRDALILGFAQTLALQPGVSRSGITITAARLRGFDRESATRLSFLMALLVVGGAGAFKTLEVFTGKGLAPGLAAPFVWGMVTSAVSGALAVAFLLRLVKTRSFTPFVVYRVLTGLAVIAIAIAR
jgi:undecaprenyl-diphosphatase